MDVSNSKDELPPQACLDQNDVQFRIIHRERIIPSTVASSINALKYVPVFEPKKTSRLRPEKMCEFLPTGHNMVTSSCPNDTLDEKKNPLFNNWSVGSATLGLNPSVINSTQSLKANSETTFTVAAPVVTTEKNPQTHTLGRNDTNVTLTDADTLLRSALTVAAPVTTTEKSPQTPTLLGSNDTNVTLTNADLNKLPSLLIANADGNGTNFDLHSMESITALPINASNIPLNLSEDFASLNSHCIPTINIPEGGDYSNLLSELALANLDNGVITPISISNCEGSSTSVPELHPNSSYNVDSAQSFEVVDANSIPLLSLSETDNNSSMEAYPLLDLLESGKILDIDQGKTDEAQPTNVQITSTNVPIKPKPVHRRQNSTVKTPRKAAISRSKAKNEKSFVHSIKTFPNINVNSPNINSNPLNPGAIIKAGSQLLNSSIFQAPTSVPHQNLNQLKNSRLKKMEHLPAILSIPGKYREKNKYRSKYVASKGNYCTSANRTNVVDARQKNSFNIQDYRNDKFIHSRSSKSLFSSISVKSSADSLKYKGLRKPVLQSSKRKEKILEQMSDPLELTSSDYEQLAVSESGLKISQVLSVKDSSLNIANNFSQPGMVKIKQEIPDSNSGNDAPEHSFPPAVATSNESSNSYMLPLLKVKTERLSTEDYPENDPLGDSALVEHSNDDSELSGSNAFSAATTSDPLCNSSSSISTVTPPPSTNIFSTQESDPQKLPEPDTSHEEDNTVSVSVNQLAASLSKILEKLQKCDTVVLKKTKDPVSSNGNIVVITDNSNAENDSILSSQDAKLLSQVLNATSGCKPEEISSLNSKLGKCDNVVQKTKCELPFTETLDKGEDPNLVKPNKGEDPNLVKPKSESKPAVSHEESDAEMLCKGLEWVIADHTKPDPPTKDEERLVRVPLLRSSQSTASKNFSERRNKESHSIAQPLRSLRKKKSVPALKLKKKLYVSLERLYLPPNETSINLKDFMKRKNDKQEKIVENEKHILPKIKLCRLSEEDQVGNSCKKRKAEFYIKYLDPVKEKTTEELEPKVEQNLIHSNETTFKECKNKNMGYFKSYSRIERLVNKRKSTLGNTKILSSKRKSDLLNWKLTTLDIFSRIENVYEKPDKMTVGSSIEKSKENCIEKMSKENPNEDMSEEKPCEEMSQEKSSGKLFENKSNKKISERKPAEKMFLERLDEDMSEAKPDEKMSEEKPGEKMSGEKPCEKISGEKPCEKISGEKPGEKISGEKPGEKISGEKPGEKMSEEKPCEKMSEEKPCEKMSEKKPCEKMSEEKPCEKMSEEKPYEKMSEEKPCEKMSEEKPCEKMSEEKPCEKMSEEKPCEKMSEEIPCEKMSEEIPCEKMSEEIPCEKMSEEKPCGKKSEEKPCGKKSEEKPCVKKSEEKPCGNKSGEKPCGKKSREKPCGKKSGEKPGEKSNVNPCGKMSEEKPCEKNPEEKPVEEKSEEKPSLKKSEEKPSLKKSEEKPSGKMFEEKPVEKMSERICIEKLSQNKPVSKVSIENSLAFDPGIANSIELGSSIITEPVCARSPTSILNKELDESSGVTKCSALINKLLNKCPEEEDISLSESSKNFIEIVDEKKDIISAEPDLFSGDEHSDNEELISTDIDQLAASIVCDDEQRKQVVLKNASQIKAISKKNSQKVDDKEGKDTFAPLISSVSAVNMTPEYVKAIKEESVTEEKMLGLADNNEGNAYEPKYCPVEVNVLQSFSEETNKTSLLKTLLDKSGSSDFQISREKVSETVTGNSRQLEEYDDKSEQEVHASSDQQFLINPLEEDPLIGEEDVSSPPGADDFFPVDYHDDECEEDPLALSPSSSQDTATPSKLSFSATESELCVQSRKRTPSKKKIIFSTISKLTNTNSNKLGFQLIEDASFLPPLVYSSLDSKCSEVGASKSSPCTTTAPSTSAETDKKDKPSPNPLSGGEKFETEETLLKDPGDVEEEFLNSDLPDNPFDPDYELPEDFNPFDLEFSSLENSKVQSEATLDPIAGPSDLQAPLMNSLDLSCASMRGEWQGQDSKLLKEEEQAADSDSDDPMDDPTYDNLNRLACPLCNFKTKSESLYHKHVVQHSRSHNGRKRVQTNHYVAPEFLSNKSRRGRGRGRQKNPPLDPLPKDFSLMPRVLNRALPKSFNGSISERLSAENDLPKSGSVQEFDLVCKKCQYFTSSHVRFRNHMMRHYKAHKCPYCPFQGASETELTIHKEVHAMQKKFNCPICPFTTLNHRYYLVHKSAHKLHRKAGDKVPVKSTTPSRKILPNLVKLKCPTCNYITLSHVSYKAHLQTHYATRKRECTKCDYVTNDEDLFISHVAKHR